MSRSQFFLMFKCYNTLTSTLENEYPSSNETSKKNGAVRGDCIACDALLRLTIPFKTKILSFLSHEYQQNKKLSGYKINRVFSIILDIFRRQRHSTISKEDELAEAKTLYETVFEIKGRLYCNCNSKD